MSDQLPLFDAGPVPDFALDPDREAREFAQDPANNVVLEASAGTGKTTVLVSRYVNLLARGVDPANILAITFTRKAAAEMRERIVRNLRRAADLSAVDRRRWLALRDRLGDIQISTIDAFCLALLREFPLEADLDPGFSLADETEVPRLIDQSLDKSLAVFVGLAKREPDIALVLAQLGLARTREGLAHLLDRRLVARDVLDRFLARGPADLTAEAVCARTMERLIDLFGRVRGGLERFLADGPVGQPRYQMLVRDFRRLGDLRDADDASIRGFLERVIDHFLTARRTPLNHPRIRHYRVEDYPGPEAGRRHRAVVLALSPSIHDIVQAFSRDLNVVLARGVRRMFSIALAQYRTALNDRSVLDFSDVLDRAVDLLGRMDEFSQSRYRLEGRYHHVLVDEFQDTSRKQWELVALLVKAWGEGLGIAANPSVFIVGDRKQSIYRFRDAEVAVLQDAGAFIEALRPGPGCRRSITRSFRAVPELLAFVNELFSEVGRGAASADDFKYDEADLFPITPDGTSRAPALGIAVADDPVTCADAVAAEIARILHEESVRDIQTGISRAARPGDVAILFRSRASHREFETALEARGIPAYVYKGLGFFDADEIKDLSALIRFLANPSSNLRAAAFLRSRFIRLSDVALAALAPRLAAALTDPCPPAALDALPADDRAILAHARTQVPRWLARVDREPPADLIEQILPEAAYAYELRGARHQQAWENLKKLRGLVRRIQNRGYATLPRIADHLDSLHAGDESNAVIEALDAVNLMTVHAAKGLEFPVVFLVNLAKGASGPPRPVRVSGDEVSVGPFVSESDEQEKDREREETKRLLYVALTRARDRLYLGSVLKDGTLVCGRGSLAEILPEPIKAVLASGAASGPLTWSAPSGRIFEFRRCAPADPDIPNTNFVIGGGPPGSHFFQSAATAGSIERVPLTGQLAAREDAGRPSAAIPEDVLVGTLVHRLFQCAEALPADVSAGQVSMLAGRLLQHTERAACGDVATLVARAAETWLSMRRHPEIVAVLASGGRLHEVPFSMTLPGEPRRILRGSIDCIVRAADGSVLVVELKTGRPQESHRAQLDLYVRAAQSMFPGSVVAGRLIYP